MFCPTENVFVLPIVRILTAILFLQNFVAAQDLEKLIIFEPSKNTFEVINEDIIDFTIKLKNQTQNNIQGKIKIEIPNSFELVSKNAILISLHAGDSTFIPIKIFVKKHATSGMAHLINISLHMDNQSEISAEPLKVQVAERKSVSLYALLSNILLDPTMDSIAIPVRVVNRGNTIQKITLVNRFPSMFNASAFHESIEFFVFPAKDTLLTFRRKVLKKMLSSDGFEVHIT